MPVTDTKKVKRKTLTSPFVKKIDSIDFSLKQKSVIMQCLLEFKTNAVEGT